MAFLTRLQISRVNTLLLVGAPYTPSPLRVQRALLAHSRAKSRCVDPPAQAPKHVNSKAASTVGQTGGSFNRPPRAFHAKRNGWIESGMTPAW